MERKFYQSVYSKKNFSTLWAFKWIRQFQEKESAIDYLSQGLGLQNFTTNSSLIKILV